jgi:hypothetical protein
VIDREMDGREGEELEFGRRNSRLEAPGWGSKQEAREGTEDEYREEALLDAG